MKTPNFDALMRLVTYMRHHKFDDRIPIYKTTDLEYTETVEAYAKEVFGYAELELQKEKK